jgi:hypothetical protein
MDKNNRNYKVRITTPADTIASQPNLRGQPNSKENVKQFTIKEIIKSKDWLHHNESGDPLWALEWDGKIQAFLNADESDDDAFREAEEAYYADGTLERSMKQFWDWEGYGQKNKENLEFEYGGNEYVEHMPTGIRIYRNEFTSEKDVKNLIKSRNDDKQWMRNRNYNFRITSSAEPKEIIEVVSPNISSTGFEFEGQYITNPMYDETGRNVVDPYKYYGEDYENWLATFEGGIAPGLPGDDGITEKMRGIQDWDEVDDTLFGVMADIGYIPDAIQNARKTYLENEDINHHTENNLMIAQLFGDEVMVRQMNDILDRSARSGRGVAPLDREWMNDNILPLHSRLFDWSVGDPINLPPSRTLSPMENIVYNVVDNQQDADYNSDLRGTILSNDPSVGAWGIDIQPFNKDDFKELVWDSWPLYFEDEGDQYVKRSYDGLTQRIQYEQANKQFNPQNTNKIKQFDPFSDSDRNKLDSFERIYFKRKTKNASGHSLQRRIDKKKYNLANREPLTKGQANTIARMVRTLPSKTNARLIRVKDGYNIYVRKR